jgi:hypothetical protein
LGWLVVTALVFGATNGALALWRSLGLASGPRNPAYRRGPTILSKSWSAVDNCWPVDNSRSLSVLATRLEIGGPPRHQWDFRSGSCFGSGSGCPRRPGLSGVAGRLDTGGRRPKPPGQRDFAYASSAASCAGSRLARTDSRAFATCTDVTSVASRDSRIAVRAASRMRAAQSAAE